VLLHSGDEPPDTRNQGSDSESATDQQFQPRQPAFLMPGREYGIASRPDSQEAWPAYGSPGSNPREPSSQSYPGGYGAPDPYVGRDPIETNGYRFRPLGEREKRRMQVPVPDQHVAPYSSGYAQLPPPVAPAPHSAPSMLPNPQQQTYSFRPLEKSPSSRGRWQGPYQRPGWRDDWHSSDPWAAPSDPQWGSTPPNQRMYPSYTRNTGRQITAR